MPRPDNFQVVIRAAYDHGLELRNRIDAHLRALSAQDDAASRHADECESLRDDVTEWFNVVAADVAPYTAYDHAFVSGLMHKAAAATRCRKFVAKHRGEANVELPTSAAEARLIAAEAMSDALRIVRTAVSGVMNTAGQPPATEHLTRNTAFLLMWMDKKRPELVDLLDTVKRVFGEFGIKAYRADDIVHSERITDLVLDSIRKAEYIFADLTGERPNVYYEIGYAHALGKRPILYRRAGTPLHFDLSVHNVPEYENFTELADLLRARLLVMRSDADLALARTHEVQSDLIKHARERIHAATLSAAPELVGEIDVATLVHGSDGLYELRIDDEGVFDSLQRVILRIEREANVRITLRCPSLEQRLLAERAAHSARR